MKKFKDLLTRSLLRDYRMSAFTLAEVLITLGIIGVVAAMTIPNLISNVQKTKTVSQLKKLFQNFQLQFEWLRVSMVIFQDGLMIQVHLQLLVLQGCLTLIYCHL